MQVLHWRPEQEWRYYRLQTIYRYLYWRIISKNRIVIYLPSVSDVASATFRGFKWPPIDPFVVLPTMNSRAPPPLEENQEQERLCSPQSYWPGAALDTVSPSTHMSLILAVYCISQMNPKCKKNVDLVIPGRGHNNG